MAGFKRTISRIAEVLADRKGSGATTAELMAELALSNGHVGGALKAMERVGTVAWHIIAEGICHNKRRWYLPEHRPAVSPQPVAPKAAKTPIRLNRAQAARGAVPVPVQCPKFEDTRFTFKPPPGWVGEITRDWQKRRLKAVQA